MDALKKACPPAQTTPEEKEKYAKGEATIRSWGCKSPATKSTVSAVAMFVAIAVRFFQ